MKEEGSLPEKAPGEKSPTAEGKWNDSEGSSLH